MSAECIVIGGGFSGLSLSTLLADAGHKVLLLEKNDSIGGRARLWRKEGFTFDMGPSWYLMPEVFEKFFNSVHRNRSDYYSTKSLDPLYKVYFENREPLAVPANQKDVVKLFDSFETHGGEKLKKYLNNAEYKYRTAISDFLYKEYSSIFQFFNKRIITEGLKLNIFKGLEKYVAGYFDSLEAKKILEYAMVFLGTAPADAPALYSIMSYVDLKLGVHFPYGGMGGVAKAFEKLAVEKGVEVLTGHEVTKIRNSSGRFRSVQTKKGIYSAEIAVMTGDYPHSELGLLTKSERTYQDKYWKKSVIAPSMFILFLGLKKRLKDFEHHNLYFSDNWNAHFDMIFKTPNWPEKPCFYLSCTTKTDSSMAPDACENVFVLVPVAPGLDDSDNVRDRYAESLLKHIENVTGEDLCNQLVVKRIYSHRDFAADYNAYLGTALGLAHTLFQTAIFRPSHRSRKVKNLYYCGHYTHPGVGVPMTLISADVVFNLISQDIL